MKSNPARSALMRTSALGLAAGLALAATGALAEARTYPFDVPAEPLDRALKDFSRVSGEQIVFSQDLVRGRTSPPLKGSFTADQALAQLLTGTTLETARSSTGVIMVRGADGPQDSGAGGGAETNVVQELIVTAQKKEEAIQTVPIAISAFTAKSLEEQKIEGGFDLLKAIPNVTFSKNNFTSYNFSIRGIGTKAVSATTDPGVAVAFNNTALLQNRLFEQEYFDVERVEVLRGPQGTLYGRNATAGVINVISAKPDMDQFKGSIKGEVGNYNSKRVSAMINVPIINDKLAIRFAGALTNRQGYDYNELTKNHVNGRDLWSGRVTIAFNPTERIRSNLIWERFNENDNRSRTGKQLCHRDPGPSDLDGTPLYKVDGLFDNIEAVVRPALFSQGCKPGSLYDDAAFGVPNGVALPFVLGSIGLSTLYGVGFTDPNDQINTGQSITKIQDPYAGTVQSHDLRTIASIKDPRYRAKADIIELNLDVDITDSLTFTSQTAYNKDSTYSFQDFNRFNTQPIFTDTSNLLQNKGGIIGPSDYRKFAPGGVFCDPQLGCTDRMVGFDIAQGKGRQFSQEFRMQSDFKGPLNFSVGANYTRFNTIIDYYVFYNLITAFAMTAPFNSAFQNTNLDQSICGSGTDFFANPTPAVVTADNPLAVCPYIDPNPIESINGEGHNYFRSKNPYKLKSAAAFGELYWQIEQNLKLTAGLRYTNDRKTFIPVPSQVLMAPGLVAGGDVNKGYPEDPPIKQHWGEFTGRLGLDWKPDLSFTDQTMFYAFYSRGYKGGGANPPSPGFADLNDYLSQFERYGIPAAFLPIFKNYMPVLQLTAVEYSRTFEPEFVNAFEVGSKNTLLSGALQFNTDAFFYDYKDYQVSQIRDRTAVNENFDAKIWGLEFETVFSPSRNFRVNANLGYLDTKISNGQESIDIMDRTAGNPGWVITKPWPQLPSNCVLPIGVAQNYVTNYYGIAGFWGLCGGVKGILGLFKSNAIDPATNLPYDPLYYDGTNGRPNIHGGAGFSKELGGNELPNSPHWTANIGAQYSHDILEGWRATLRGDAYWQSQSWARVYNDDPYDKLHGWYNLNLSLWVEKPEIGLKIEVYAKNVLDKTPITDAFLNSDDTALTTNVFVLDPRIIGVSLTKTF